jgi:hypothetical protein
MHEYLKEFLAIESQNLLYQYQTQGRRHHESPRKR